MWTLVCLWRGGRNHTWTSLAPLVPNTEVFELRLHRLAVATAPGVEFLRGGGYTRSSQNRCWGEETSQRGGLVAKKQNRTGQVDSSQGESSQVQRPSLGVSSWCVQLVSPTCSTSACSWAHQAATQERTAGHDLSADWRTTSRSFVSDVMNATAQKDEASMSPSGNQPPLSRPGTGKRKPENGRETTTSPVWFVRPAVMTSILIPSGTSPSMFHTIPYIHGGSGIGWVGAGDD